jgi:hypothetical protein
MAGREQVIKVHAVFQPTVSRQEVLAYKLSFVDLEAPRRSSFGCPARVQPTLSWLNLSAKSATLLVHSEPHLAQPKEDAMTILRSEDHAREAHIDTAIEIFEPRYGHKLTREDGRQIYDNLTGFFRVLLRLQRRRELAQRGEK